jgi:uncharacterized membrane protein HdeD (DUF308 family)
MSDTSVPATRVPFTRDTVLGLARTWWLCLLLGILWILFGMFVLSYNVGSQLALAVVTGITFIAAGVNEVITAGRVERWQWLWLVGGVLSIIAGIITFVWPGHTLRYLAGILAWFLVVKGIVDTVGALASIGRPWWWKTLLLGLVELLLGIWAAGYPGRSLFVFVNLVGIYAVFHGLAEVLTAFDLRRLGQALGRSGRRIHGEG